MNPIYRKVRVAIIIFFAYVQYSIKYGSCQILIYYYHESCPKLIVIPFLGSGLPHWCWATCYLDNHCRRKMWATFLDIVTQVTAYIKSSVSRTSKYKIVFKVHNLDFCLELPQYYIQNCSNFCSSSDNLHWCAKIILKSLTPFSFSCWQYGEADVDKGFDWDSLEVREVKCLCEDDLSLLQFVLHHTLQPMLQVLFP